ncbi:peptidoglycan DD-metalloendopeptidase family protein [Alteromonas sp. ASW11-130]|uniref:peptidoglycan DD-metalloendopeptidase family protein n=1 Tax=Alteromonas sp. ASW11-130 TaxID=3015775 RepID=UPI0022420F12|nr:peptidoglycan DD-metalloendopeptidase family protein [Alteromonas sp. ASW11-130]MCW8091891.1 peptidoglycan DD-metalloendopeptidase family protein [Alteromonas sp. ASW11-130]
MKSPRLRINVLFVATCVVIMLAGCAGRRAPAPLVLLDSQPVKEQGYDEPTYTVRRGETLYAIAWFTGKDYRDLAKFNNLAPPYPIYPGQELKLNATQASTGSVRSAKAISRAKSGQTSSNKSINKVDRRKQQAYGESENNVNNQPVKAVGNTQPKRGKPGKKGFPKRVEKWVWPAYGKLVATFSTGENGSKGIDISAKKGSPILAAAAGKVVYAGNALRGYGNLIIIKHTDTFLSAYAHNDTIAVREQQWVDAGQSIATMGNSGTNSVRLHFEVRYRGKSLDPMRYLPSSRP